MMLVHTYDKIFSFVRFNPFMRSMFPVMLFKAIYLVIHRSAYPSCVYDLLFASIIKVKDQGI